MRTGGNNNNGNIQTEGYNHGNVNSTRNGNRDKGLEKAWQSGGRKYKQGTQKDTGNSQTTLNEFWTGKEKDLWTWSEGMEELDGLDVAQKKASQESILSYV